MEQQNIDGLKVLKNSRCCLSGGIDRVPDDGIQWRQYIKEQCKNKKLEIKFFDPCNKPKSLGSETGIEKILVRNMINNGEWEKAKEFVKTFRHYDLRAIDWCDFVIVKIDINSHLCGTYDEIFLAEREHKAILVIMGEGQTKKDIPAWLVAFINEKEIFESPDECINYLCDMDSGKIQLDSRWVKLE
jgi:hypothetical protein